MFFKVLFTNTGLVTDMEDDECSDQRPLIKTDECTFAYIKHSNLYVVATTRKNSNIAMLFTLLHKICAVMQEYFKEVGFPFTCMAWVCVNISLAGGGGEHQR